ncbi:plasmid mobilization protein [Butyrivibrio sp. INlla14]|uniref:plasmid mobilization protein n=1 Tax=Butyrivibrio sp. INlla14 TaxID=1520808 RepID=UPI000877337E|nr:plasmid mobilization relaxosome protein MobC [Butyrivibrio sp. INlla14]SCY63135.1 hypothetical protein SAMN02910371_03120 [Butyrivibrio sp. INlla14]
MERTVFLGCRLTLSEKEILDKRMEECGIRSISSYMRKMALNGYIVRVDLADVKEVLRLLKINSNNLNQYAHKANATGSIYMQDIEKLRSQHEEILDAMGVVLDKLNGMKV